MLWNVLEAKALINSVLLHTSDLFHPLYQFTLQGDSTAVESYIEVTKCKLNI
jgi:hypothetical protein